MIATSCPSEVAASPSTKSLAQIARGTEGSTSGSTGSPKAEPEQREAAAQWGVSLANAKGKQGHIKSASDLLGLFKEALPDLTGDLTGE